MGTISWHSNQSSYRTGKKNTIIHSPDRDPDALYEI